ncbi:hypothetical protein TG4357_02229 [Thalassovita gelatinovora]|uniref:Glutamyl-tRNA synthetase n=1 Tax=Thalassovita gelatinovora TaxID=53501 RepID=A0A0P1FDB7_THAGE|nr:DUF4202 domain-containing protein [Thalassovita gelatinovora]QIZ80576.1 DUF4202 domain-containing protein [Thalassovita gelatinovora]CUH66089.1 hypothetical protein TG4357_02229 [Thalassovita gelatinovora]SEQ76700.1 protein of unknown function [Thalassovita gelatinovora]
MTRLTDALAAIDSANSADPTLEGGRPAALLYGERMSEEVAKLFPDASEVLQIAARGQHVERWLLPRKDYPEGKAGYYAWRKEQGRRHGERVAGIMAEAGYLGIDQDRVRVLLRKEGIKTDPEVQALEDVICFTFIRWYLKPFADDRSQEQLVDIVTKTARKMSPEGRARALADFDMPDALATAFRV